MGFNAHTGSISLTTFLAIKQEHFDLKLDGATAHSLGNVA